MHSPGRTWSRIINIVNYFFVPIRLIIPQPLVAKIPLLRTNEEERAYRVLTEYRGKALDVGCGANRIIKTYRLFGHEGIGVDVYDWHGPDMVVLNTANLPFDFQSFDTISFVACLNHIPNRDDVLRETRRLLKPDGQIIITNLSPLVSRIWHKIAFWDDDQHIRGMKEGEVWGFSERELYNIVTAHGFRLKKRVGFMWGLNHLYIFEIK